MAPLVIGYCLALLLFLGLPCSSRVNSSLRTDEVRTRRTSNVLGIVHLIALLAPVAAALTEFGPRVAPWVAWTAAAIMLAGLMLQRWAQHSLGKNFTLALQSAENQHICTRGPYRLIRHPAYLAQILIWDGLAWTSRSIIAGITIAALAVAAYVYRLSEEGKVLVNSLGAKYQAYAGKTKRLFPYLW